MTKSQPKPNPLVTNILVPMDFSDCSRQALSWALTIAKHSGARVTLLHVILPRHSPLEHVEEPRSVLKKLEADLAQQGWPDTVRHSLVIKSGAWSAVSQVAAERKIDLIVTGTHGRRGLEVVLMGSFAETVFRRVRCPVLTVGPRSRPAEVNATLRSILFATDFSEESEAAEPYAFSLARSTGARLTLLHAVKPGRIAKAQQMEKRRTYAKAKLEATALDAAAERCGSHPDLLVEAGSPADAILKIAEQVDADLVVLGASAPRRLADRLGNTTAYRVVCAARCPVLTIRQPPLIDYFQHLFAAMPKMKSTSHGQIRSSSRSVPYAWWDPNIRTNDPRHKS